MQAIFTQTVETPIGPILVRADRQYITHIQFADTIKSGEPLVDHSTSVPDHLLEAVEQLHRYFENPGFQFQLPLAPAQTAFQTAVRNVLLNVGPGETASYKTLSERLGRPQASRAVGMALGKNPILIVIPCHCIVGSSGSLTGFAGGIHRKKWLLEHERQAGISQDLAFELKSG